MWSEQCAWLPFASKQITGVVGDLSSTWAKHCIVSKFFLGSWQRTKQSYKQSEYWTSRSQIHKITTPNECYSCFVFARCVISQFFTFCACCAAPKWQKCSISTSKVYFWEEKHLKVSAEMWSVSTHPKQPWIQQKKQLHHCQRDGWPEKKIGRSQLIWMQNEQCCIKESWAPGLPLSQSPPPRHHHVSTIAPSNIHRHQPSFIYIQ